MAAGGASGSLARKLREAARRGQQVPCAYRICGADVGAKHRRATQTDDGAFGRRGRMRRDGCARRSARFAAPHGDFRQMV